MAENVDLISYEIIQEVAYFIHSIFQKHVTITYSDLAQTENARRGIYMVKVYCSE